MAKDNKKDKQVISTGKVKAKKFWGTLEKVTVILIIIVALGILAFLNLPRTEVVITPASVGLEEVLSFALSELEAAQITETSVNITRRTQATGRRTVGISKATGDIVLLNQNPEEVVVPKGTEVMTGSEIRFETIEEVVVPGVTTQFFMDVPAGIQAGQAEVQVEAIEPGSRGNISSGRIKHIVGFDLDVRNPEPTSGGEDASHRVASEEDVGRAKELLKRDAPQLAREALFSELKEGVFLEDTIKYDIDWLEGTPPGEEAEEVVASAVIRTSGYSLDSSTLGTEVLEALPRIVPSRFELVPESVQIQDVTVSDDLHLEVAIKAVCRGVIERSHLYENLLGARVDDIQGIIESIPEIDAIRLPEDIGEQLPRFRNWLRITIKQE